jgi:hypothetical protein
MESDHQLNRNASVLGRLLEELSWRGETIRDYRNGGRGYENVLTAEVLQGLDFLPRSNFLGKVIANSTGADKARALLALEVEDALFTLLPGNQYLISSGKRHQTKLPVQPDGIVQSPSTFMILEAKRVYGGSFMPQQLTREYVLALRDAGNRTPLLWLILGEAPPVKIQSHGKRPISEAISLHVESVLSRAEGHTISPEEATARIEEIVCWITWEEISKIVETQMANLACVNGGPNPSQLATLSRLASSVSKSNCMAW